MPEPPEPIGSLHFYRLPALLPLMTLETPDPAVSSSGGGSGGKLRIVRRPKGGSARGSDSENLVGLRSSGQKPRFAG